MKKFAVVLGILVLVVPLVVNPAWLDDRQKVIFACVEAAMITLFVCVVAHLYSKYIDKWRKE